MEKPGGISLAEFETLIDTVKQSGKVFHTGYMYR
jgi:predicted dehydrogenase